MDKTTIITVLVIVGWVFTEMRIPISIGGGNTLLLGSLIGVILILIGLVMLNFYYGPMKRTQKPPSQRNS